MAIEKLQKIKAKNAAIGAAIGAGAAFGACKLLKCKKKTTIIAVLLVTAAGAMAGYKF